MHGFLQAIFQDFNSKVVFLTSYFASIKLGLITRTQ